MSINKRTLFNALMIFVALLLTGKFILCSSVAAASSDLEYFKGKWTVTLKSSPQSPFSWTVKEDLGKSWLSGVVERNGERISTDFWRQTDKKIERFAFTTNGVFVKIESSSGWESNRMVLTGILSQKTGETKIRETITKVSEQQFHALWEQQNSDGKWSEFSDETCTRQQ